MSIQPITKAEVALLQKAVKEDARGITKQTATLAKTLFATLEDKDVTLSEGLDREKLEALSRDVKYLAWAVLGWSDFRKFVSALRNLLSGEGAVSSAHLLYRELDKKDMLDQLQAMQKKVRQLENHAKELKGSIFDIIKRRRNVPYDELKQKVNNLMPLKNLIEILGEPTVKELKAISSNQKSDEKVEDPDIEAIWQDICGKMQTVNKDLQEASNKLYYEHMRWLFDEGAIEKNNIKEEL